MLKMLFGTVVDMAALTWDRVLACYFTAKMTLGLRKTSLIAALYEGRWKIVGVSIWILQRLDCGWVSYSCIYIHQTVVIYLGSSIGKDSHMLKSAELHWNNWAQKTSQDAYLSCDIWRLKKPVTIRLVKFFGSLFGCRTSPDALLVFCNILIKMTLRLIFLYYGDS